MKKYRIIGKQGEGTFSKVLKGKNIETKQLVAIKCMKKRYSSLEDVNNLNEIRSLQLLSHHKCIITLLDILYNSKSGRLILIFNSMEKNLYELIRDASEKFSRKRVRRMIHQLLRALKFAHANDVFHRDIKPENILVSNINNRIQLQLADFGSSRSSQENQPYTEYIATRWYRAPECLLTDGFYSFEMDIWSTGCVMYEIATFKPLFPGSNEANQMEKIIETLGFPSKQLLRRFNSLANEVRIDSSFVQQKSSGIPSDKIFSNRSLDLLHSMLRLDPCKRVKASVALDHSYFNSVKREFHKLPKKTVRYNKSVTKRRTQRIRRINNTYKFKNNTKNLTRLPSLEVSACALTFK